jgi:hypothetical protein
MISPDNETNAFQKRTGKSGLDFTRPYSVEFFSVLSTQEEAVIVAKQYLDDYVKGEKFDNIMTQPINGGMELILAKTMLVTQENISAFENKLAERLSAHEGHLNGWRIIRE